MASLAMTLVLPDALPPAVAPSYFASVPPRMMPGLNVRYGSATFSRNSFRMRATS